MTLPRESGSLAMALFCLFCLFIFLFYGILASIETRILLGYIKVLEEVWSVTSLNASLWEFLFK